VGALFPGRARLKIAWRQGSVMVTAAADDQLSWAAEPDVAEVIEHADEVTLRSEARRPSKLTVRVPAAMTGVHVDVGMGECSLEGLSNPVNLNVGLGPARMEHLRSSVKANLGKGDLDAADVSGDLDVNVGMGDLKVKSFRGRIKANAGAGSAQLEDAVVSDGSVNAGAGSIRLTRVGGTLSVNGGLGSVSVDQPVDLDLTASSGLGGLRLDGGRLARLKAEVGHGDLHLDGTRLQQADVSVKSGNVYLRLAADQTGRVEAQAQKGRVKTGLNRIQVPFPGGRRPGERVLLTLGPGPEEIVVEARRGHIVVEQAPRPPGGQEMEGTSPSAPVHPPSADPRRLILERLQRGELTPDEAARLLDGLAPNPPEEA
jgi:DUF4097 and DUF4098 domain-containing protein YvlB